MERTPTAAAAAAAGGASTSGSKRRGGDEEGEGEEGEIDVSQLLGKSDKIKALMRRDPKFIGRLIVQLDKHMHQMMAERRERLESARADEEAIARIDRTVETHVAPHLARLRAGVREKEALRDEMRAALERQLGETKGLQSEVAALVSRARHTSGRLMSKTASDRLLEARGFAATVPTTELIRGGGKQGGGGGGKAGGGRGGGGGTSGSK